MQIHKKLQLFKIVYFETQILQIILHALIGITDPRCALGAWEHTCDTLISKKRSCITGIGFINQIRDPHTQNLRREICKHTFFARQLLYFLGHVRVNKCIM
jgi:hypothetical protein